MQLELFTHVAFFKQNKTEFLDKNDIFMDVDFFYMLHQKIVYPDSLLRIVDYLNHVEQINLYLDTTLVAFVNLIVIAQFLNTHHYKNKLILVFYHPQTYQVLLKREFRQNLLQESLHVYEYLQGNHEVSFHNDFYLVLPHFKQCIALYESVYYQPMQFEMILDKCQEESENIDEVIDNFFVHYAEYGFTREYILERLKTKK